MRRGHKGRVDANHMEIMAALRTVGCTVQSLASVGEGCPDLLVGCNGQNVLLEVKGVKGAKTPEQWSWHADWQGRVRIVRSAKEAIAVVRQEATMTGKESHL